MSIMLNPLGSFMPHFEARSSKESLASLNAEVMHTVNGDESALIYIDGRSLSGTYNIDGSVDGSNFFALPSYLFSGLGGTVLPAGQPFFTEAVTAAMTYRVICAAVAGLVKIRVRLSAYTSGSCEVTIRSEASDPISPYIRDQKASTHVVSITGAVGAGVTATLPAIAGLRHYIDQIEVRRIATAALTASAAPVLITTTNLPGNLGMSFGADTGGIGVEKVQILDFGSSGLSATAIGSSSSVIAPAYAGIIWRINVIYRLGL